MAGAGYYEVGYLHLKNLIPVEIARAFLNNLKQDLPPGPIALSDKANHSNLLDRPAFELYSALYKPMEFFLWGLTPIMERITDRALLPTYDYFRLYREGDVCRVHSDRYACEHSLSLTLDYSDGETWDLQIATQRSEPSTKVDPDFYNDSHSSITMEVGDAVLYQGVHHRHGRITPNPNGWSAHLFLHWIERDGAYRDHAFDGREDRTPAIFSFI